ncbi:MAG: hypothetical protein AAFP69_16315, partial [Planctomycetota bacterium]
AQFVLTGITLLDPFASWHMPPSPRLDFRSGGEGFSDSQEECRCVRKETTYLGTIELLPTKNSMANASPKKILSAAAPRRRQWQNCYKPTRNHLPEPNHKTHQHVNRPPALAQSLFPLAAALPAIYTAQ